MIQEILKHIKAENIVILNDEYNINNIILKVRIK